mmetsp:Transcript_18149/g.33167  ORF Transcript_18149/g.33167 Transcript_18149/m.33167 type:complete len:234 (-) Transcript_18149:574-1275(-)|eukprot:CAMPEP_0175063762 /NCGR_PEP_ID=MMETSP0052_2-20121109/14944_1 /TAXON_ID=51329 ORGANISM="Polytomella parva, Strain SAG 63-3" /NCGR_SAMPLE_ID=MMETSP0052_2 /ASSEMBLY_ACC=CAM_ASM_000194 /LENGTH=233 /DNA_ID=CAMNT_0016330011 /DNA_START=39 /DNA_END=740 /DNA_ORIENTATION=+
MSDTLERTTKFLAKRDGIDKTLKLIRYVSKLNIALSEPSETVKILKNFEKSISVSRKAYRLGKFLQCVNSARGRNDTGLLYAMGMVADIGEGFYLFLDQILWLIKVGVVSGKNEKIIAKFTAGFEFFGYLGNFYCLYRSISKLLGQIDTLEQKLAKASKDGVAVDSGLLEQLAKVRKQLLLKKLGLTQDLCDSVMCLSDLGNGNNPVLDNPVLLASLGIASGACSFTKVWLSV